MENDNKKSQISDQVKSVLTSEVKFIIGIITIALGVIAPFYQIKQDIALMQKDISVINANHLSHLQDTQKTIEEIKVEQSTQQKQIIDLNNEILVLLGKRLNN